MRGQLNVKKKPLDFAPPAHFPTGTGIYLCHHTQIDPRGNPVDCLNPLNAELNPICHLPTLLGAHRILHVRGVRVNDYQGRNGRYRELDCADLPPLPLHTATVRTLDIETICKDRRRSKLRTVITTCCKDGQWYRSFGGSYCCHLQVVST